jgi:hypothetical protein
VRCDADARYSNSTSPKSSIALESPKRTSGLLAGDRAPDAPVSTSAGRSTRLFELFKGAHWTLLGYEVERDLVQPRPSLHIHTFGVSGDLIDRDGYFRAGYHVLPGDWVLVRPDGYVGAIVASGEIAVLQDYLRTVGLAVEYAVDV